MLYRPFKGGQRTKQAGWSLGRRVLGVGVMLGQNYCFSSSGTLLGHMIG